MNNRIERFAFDFFAGKTGIVFQQDRFARQTITENDASLLDLYFFGAGHGDAQPHRDVVGDVIAAHGEDAALLHRSIDIKNVIGRASANVDDKGPEIFLVLGENNLRRSKRAEDHVFDIERQLFHTPDGVLNAGPHAVDDVKISFQFFAEHPDRIENAILSIDMVMLDD